MNIEWKPKNKIVMYKSFYKLNYFYNKILKFNKGVKKVTCFKQFYT